MRHFKNHLIILSLFIIVSHQLSAQKNDMAKNAEETMLLATKYMVEEVSTNGGFLWFYLPDFSRQWGEMEAYHTMVWMQGPGTVNMGHTFLDAYKATGNEYYYKAAEKAATAIIWGQSHEGGWNYMVDFAGDRSLKHWYNTIGKNGWRLEEFHHYYGNSTFDDDVTSNAAKFLLRIYLEKMDPKYKPALDKAIDYVLKSQYPLGGWPQRYPLMYEFNKKGHPDYSSFYTFNDDVTWENVHFLIQCYELLGEERFLDPIKRGMNFYLISQDGCGGWGLQLDMDLQVAGARTYEPTALHSGTTFGNAMLLLRFYELTGDKKFLNAVPEAIEWLEETRLPEDKVENGRTHASFVECGTNKPIYVHRKGSNVMHGYYYVDYEDENLLGHYGGKRRIPIERLKEEFERMTSMPIDEVTKDSPLKPVPYSKEGTPQDMFRPNGFRRFREQQPDKKEVKEIINRLDEKNRWLVKHGITSNPYVGDGFKTELTDKYASTNVGDETDTSPFRDPSDQEYISTGAYIRNMNTLINFLRLNN